MLFSVVVPVYNSPVLAELADRVDKAFSEVEAREYELIFVDDASPDPSVWRTLTELAEARPQIKAIQLTRNFGQQAATICGLAASSGEFVITMDDDLQHDPADLPALLESTDRDIVIGQFGPRHHSLFKRLTSALKSYFDRIVVGTPRGLRMTSYRMLSRAVVDGVLKIRTPNPFLPALIFHVSRNAVGVPVTHHPRAGGRSGYTLWKMIRVFSNLLINNSSLVLRAVGQIGILFSFVSFAFFFRVVYRKLAHGIAVAGWASLFATLLLIGGLLLLSLGVVGEYLIRIIQASEAKPTYFVRRMAGVGHE